MTRLALFVVFCLLSIPTQAQDAIPINLVQFIGPGGDIGSWPITTLISQVDIKLNGVEAQFDKRQGPGRWPDNTTPGWDGPLQYSLGLVLKVYGQWYASAPIETWYGNNVIGGPIQEPGEIPLNWFYDARWGPLWGYQPVTSEHIGLFVVAGDPRNNFTPVRERSNIVLLTMPAPGTVARFNFVTPGFPPPPPPPSPLPPDLAPRVEILERANAELRAVVLQLGIHVGGIQLQASALYYRIVKLESKPIPISCSAGISFGAFKVPLSCKLGF